MTSLFFNTISILPDLYVGSKIKEACNLDAGKYTKKATLDFEKRNLPVSTMLP